MRVYNLACHNEHAFEGWFSSQEDFESQRLGGQIQCPVCDSASIEKRLHAPVVLRGGVSRTAPPLPRSDESEALGPASQRFEDALENPNVPMEAKRRLVQQALRAHLKATTLDVGERFASEARAMHYGEKPSKTIRGVTTAKEANALMDEGIGVMPIPFAIDATDLH